MSDHAPIPVLIDFHYGGLDTAQTARVRRHLNDCAECYSLSVSLRGEREALRAGVQASARGGSGSSGKAAISRPTARRLGWRPGGASLRAAALVVGLSLGVVLSAATLIRQAALREQQDLAARQWREEAQRMAQDQERAAKRAQEQADRASLLESQIAQTRDQLALDLARTEARLSEVRDRTALELASLRENVDREKARADALQGETARVRGELEKELAQEREKRREELKSHQGALAELVRKLETPRAAPPAPDKPAPPAKPKSIALRPDDGVSVTWEPPARVNVPTPLLCRGTPVGWALQLGASGAARSDPPLHDPLPQYTGVAGVGGRIFVGTGWSQRNLVAFTQAGKRLWEYASSDNGVGTPVLSEDGETVYFSTESCTVYALAATSGRLLWSRQIGPTAMTQPALLGRTRLYVVAQGYAAPPPPPPEPPSKPKDEGLKSLDLFNKGSTPGNPGSPAGPGAAPVVTRSFAFTLWCLNVKDGAVLWTRGLAAEAVSSPVVDDDKVFVTTRDGVMSAFQAETGNPLWSSNASATTAPSISGGMIYFSTWAANSKFGFEESLACLPIDGGTRTKELLAGPFPASYLVSLDPSRVRQDVVDGPRKVPPPPVIEGTSEEDKALGQALRRARPTVPALKHEWAYLGGRPTIVEDQAYTAVGSSVISWDLKRNCARWEVALTGEADGILSVGEGQPPLTPPAYADGKLYFGSIWGDLFSLDAASGRLLWRYRLSRSQGIASQVVLDRGNLIATTRKGLLLSIDTRDALATGWPMWGGSPGHNSRK